MKRFPIAVAASLLGTTVLASVTAPAQAAPSPDPAAELSWTLTCDGEVVAIASAAAPDVRGHDPVYTPVFTDAHAVFVLVSGGLATGTITDPDGVVVWTAQLQGPPAQGGGSANKGGVNARDCLAVADSTTVWSTDGSHLHIEMPMRVAAVGRG